MPFVHLAPTGAPTSTVLIHGVVLSHCLDRSAGNEKNKSLKLVLVVGAPFEFSSGRNSMVIHSDDVASLEFLSHDHCSFRKSVMNTVRLSRGVSKGVSCEKRDWTRNSNN